MQSVWSIINLNQLLFLFPLFSLSLPSNSLLLFQALAFAHGDLALFQFLFSYIFKRAANSSSPYNSQFQLLGYQSSNFMQNSANLLSLFLLSLCFLLLFALLLLCKYHRIKKCSRKAIRCTIWSFFPRFFIEAFLEFLLTTTLNIRQVYTKPSQFYFFLACLALLFVICIPFLILGSLFPTQSYLPKKRTLPLFSSLNPKKGLYALSFHAVMCFHRFIFVICVFWLEGIPIAQLVVMLVLSLLFLIYLGILKPFISITDLVLNLINAFFLIFLYSWGLALLFLTSTSERRSEFGRVLIYGVIGIIGFNFIYILLSALRSCFTKRNHKKNQPIYVSSSSPDNLERIPHCTTKSTKALINIKASEEVLNQAENFEVIKFQKEFLTKSVKLKKLSH